MNSLDFLNIKTQHLNCIKTNIENLTQNLHTVFNDNSEIAQRLIQYNKAYESVGGINLDFIDTEWYQVIINLRPFDDLHLLESKTFNFVYDNLTEKFEELINEYNFKKETNSESTYSLYIRYKKTINDIVPKYKIILPCLFKGETNEELNFLFDYYRARGVEKFFLYYNGNLSNRISSLPEYEDVEYLEINVPVHSVRRDHTIKVSQDTQWWGYMQDGLLNAKNIKWIEYAFNLFQHPFLQIIKYRYLPLSRYTLSVDADELFYCKSTSLIDFLDSTFSKTNQTAISMESKFVNINETYFVFLKESKLARRKYIYTSDRVKDNKPLSVHWGNSLELDDNSRNKIDFFHLCSKTNHADRFDWNKHKQEDLVRVPIDSYLED